MANFEVKAILSAAMLSILCACSKQQTQSIIIRAVLPDEQSKVALDKPQNFSGIVLKWESGDKLKVIGDGESVFTICDGFTDHSAEFSGKPVGGNSFTVLYPGDVYGSEQQILQRSYVGQVQNGNGSTAHLEWNAMLKDIPDYSHMSFSSGKRNGVFAVSAMLPEEVSTVQYLSISAKTPLFYTSNDPSVEKVAEMRLDFQNVDISEDHTLNSYMMTSWEDMPLPAGEVLTITIVVNPSLKFTKRLTVPAGGLTVKAGAMNVIRLYGDAASSNMNSNLEGFIWTDDNFWK